MQMKYDPRVYGGDDFRIKYDLECSGGENLALEKDSLCSQRKRKVWKIKISCLDFICFFFFFLCKQIKHKHHIFKFQLFTK